MVSTNARVWRRMGTGVAIAAMAAVVLAAGGSLDASYGNGGVTSTGGESGAPRGFAVQPDGMTLVGGNRSGSWRIERYTTSGSLDSGFGTAGAVTLFGNGSSESLRDLAVDAAGRCVAVGLGNVPGKKPGSYTLTATVVRLLSSGSLDASFGSGGVVRLTVPGASASQQAASTLALQPDGRIVVAGSAAFTARGQTTTHASVARLLGNGAVDAGFGSSGFSVDTSIAITSVWAVALQATGKIVLAQRVDLGDSSRICRFLAGGGVDAGFAPVVLGGDRLSVAVDRFDRIVATGDRWAGGGYDAIAVRFTPSGTVDASFGSGGTTTVHGLYPSQSFGAAKAAAFQADDKIVTSAIFATAPGSPGTFDACAAVRLTDSGALDSTYGSGGVGTVLSLGGSGGATWAQGIGLDPTGAAMLCGGATGVGSWNWFVARYLAQ